MFYSKNGFIEHDNLLLGIRRIGQHPLYEVERNGYETALHRLRIMLFANCLC